MIITADSRTQQREPQEMAGSPAATIPDYLKIDSWLNWEANSTRPEIATHARRVIEGCQEGKDVNPGDMLPPELSNEPSFAKRMQARIRTSISVKTVVLALKAPESHASSDPDYQPNFRIDIPRYVSSWSQDYQQYQDKLVAQVPAIDPRCRLSLAIPVAVHEEGQYVLDTLKAFSRQSAAPGSYEIALFLNYPTNCKPEQLERARETTKRIEEFRADHPDMNIIVFKGALEGRTIRTIGFIRSVLNDAILKRSVLSGHEHDPILLRGDADTRAVPNRYLENFILKFDQHPTVDAFVGRLRWSPEHSQNNPLVYANLVLTEISDLIGRQEHGYLPIGGPLYGVRGSVFSLVNGYNVRTRLGEDVELAVKVRDFREGSTRFKAHADVGPQGRLYTSTRRAEAALWHGEPCMNQWSISGTAFGTSNAEIRSAGPDESIAPVFEDKEKLRAILQLIINKMTCGQYFDRVSEPSDRVPKPSLKRFIDEGIRGHLGLEVSVIGDALIRIKSIDKFLERFEDYRQNGIQRWHRSLER